MPRDRKAIAARKRKESQEKQDEKLSRHNAYGYNDLTAYEAIKNIEHEERKRKLHADRKGM